MDPEAVNLVQMQIVRAARERHFEITAYCFMPDHVHLIAQGLDDRSDCKAFIKSAKQYSGFYFTQLHHQRLWERYGFERVIRDDHEWAFTIGYIVANPVRAGLVEHPSNYLHLGSQRYTVAELLEICEYDKNWV
jgi:REP-associated tyrosine transposase